MTTATLSTRMTLGGDDTEVEVDYSYTPRDKELVVEAAVAVLETQRYPIWDLLTDSERERIREDCVTDYYDRMEQDPRRVRGMR